MKFYVKVPVYYFVHLLYPYAVTCPNGKKWTKVKKKRILPFIIIIIIFYVNWNNVVYTF